MTETPDAPKTDEPADRAPARTPTAEFRVPDVTKTREDIPVRRPEAATTRAERLPTPPDDDDPDANAQAEAAEATDPEEAEAADREDEPDADAPDAEPTAEPRAKNDPEKPNEQEAEPQAEVDTDPADDATADEAPPAADEPSETTAQDEDTPQAADDPEQHTSEPADGTTPAEREDPPVRPDAAGQRASEPGSETAPEHDRTDDEAAPARREDPPRRPDKAAKNAAEAAETSDTSNGHNETTPTRREAPPVRPEAAEQRASEADSETAPEHDRTNDDAAPARRGGPPHRPDEAAKSAAEASDTSNGHNETAPADNRPSNDPAAAEHEDPPRRSGAAEQRTLDTSSGRSETAPTRDRTGEAAAMRREAPPRRPGEDGERGGGESRGGVAQASGGAAGARYEAPPRRPGEAGPEATRTVVDLPVPVASPAVPEVYRGEVSEGEGGLVRFVGYEPVGDVTRQDVPRVAEAPEDERSGRRAWPWVLVAVLVVVMAVVTAQLVRPVPEPELRLTIAAEHTFPGAAPQLPWPGSGQSAVFVEGLGMMGASGNAVPAPTASVAKVMTAYVYLRDHPLRPGEPGPTLAVSPEGVAEMPMRRQRGESLLGITQGQRLTQRKALEALMIISANDVAHELAKWDAGSVQAFVAKMNAAARELGMTNTTYTDPSGYDSGTVSTAADQVKLLRAAMAMPAFAEIVNKRTFVPADGGPVREGGNFLLGQFGVVGGKTGFTDAAGGNFVFAARKDVAGVSTLIVGAVMGQRTASAAGAVSAAGGLVQAAEGALTSATLAQAGARVAVVDDGLGGTTPVRAASAVTVVGWPGLTVAVAAHGEPPAEAAAGEETGTLTAGAARVPLRFGDAYGGPALVDRLIRLG
ncbi:hypothetical protein AB0L25_01405 [Spirillospora sp. NPDC052242]